MLKTVSLWYCFIFLSMISNNFNIIVNRMIRTPRHGKDMVDENNICDRDILWDKYV